MGDFSLSYVFDKLSEAASTEKPENVNLQPYCEAWIEIARFFSFINIGFAFVGANVRSSCNELLQAQKTSKIESVIYLKDALPYDLQFGGCYQTYSSITWLHRPLEFILSLFADLSNLDDEKTPVTQLAIDNYLATMGRFHSWPVQQMTKFLFYTLPDWESLRKNTMNTNYEITCKLMKEIIEIGEIVYERTENMLQEFNSTHPPYDLAYAEAIESEID